MDSRPLIEGLFFCPGVRR
ncbi:pyrBI operon leader peptide [Citrobacter koseri]